MTFPRHRSRTIAVGGDDYRWIVSREDDKYVQRLRVEHASSPGSRLVHAFGRPPGAPPTPMTPGRVRGLIELARLRGWAPARRGPDFVIPPWPPAGAPLSTWDTTELLPVPSNGPLSLESWAMPWPVDRGFPW